MVTLPYTGPVVLVQPAQTRLPPPTTIGDHRESVSDRNRNIAADDTRAWGGIADRLVRVVFGLVLGLLISEFVARALVQFAAPYSYNPIIRKQSEQAPFFVVDPDLGHRLRDGFVGVYQKGFVPWQQLVSEAATAQKAGRAVVLNVGDSSTSGWNSNVIKSNRERAARGLPPLSPFQTYPTYSDQLKTDPKLYSINAGVPGYGATQGALFLQRILSDFHAAGVRPDIVTLYFGNNDSAWNGNVEDKYQFAGFLSLQLNGFQVRRFINQMLNGSRIIPRTLPFDYGSRMKEMVDGARRAGAAVVLIEPAIPYAWPPALRADGLEEEVHLQRSALRGTRVGQSLDDAMVFFDRGMQALKRGQLSEARGLLDQARESDYILPRIKHAHQHVLTDDVMRALGVPLVSVSTELSQRVDDRDFFIDYCHPNEFGSKLIAERLRNVISAALRAKNAAVDSKER